MVVATRTECQTTAYARAVLAEEIPACRLIRLACQRHLSDLGAAPERGLHFDEEAAQHATEFFGFLKHSKGEWAGQPFVLAPWQTFIIGCIFGWKLADGRRRFRQAYVEVPRKNGKSTLAAGVELFLFVADHEPGAEVYNAATKRDQARIAHSEATRMVRASPALRRHVRIFKDNLSIEGTASKCEPLGADADTMDGLNIHGAIIDELHAHKTRDVVDVLETGTGARRQPLIFEITTAGFNQESICREHHDYSVQVLEGTVEDDTWFGYIAALDEGDDWADPAAWAKANPNFGLTVKVEDLERKCLKARQLPAAQTAFARLHGNVWPGKVGRFIDLALWDANAGEVNEAELANLECYGGLDLSSVQDMTAWLMVFPYAHDPDEVDILCRFWVPEARLTDPRNRYRAQYQAWVREGFLHTTPGEAVDYTFIKEQILADAAKFGLVDMSIDRLFQGYQVGTELQEEGVKVAGMGQGFLSMAAPMKEFERRLVAKKLHHGGHPVLRFNAANLVVKQDAAANLKPDKAESQGRIDGIPALLGALDRLIRHREGPRSVYDERGVRYL